MDSYDIIIIGGGPAGMGAALGAAGSGFDMRILIIERGEVLGGILNQCTHSGFGITYFGEELTGQEYAHRFVRLVDDSDIEVLTDTMVMGVRDDGVVTVSGRKSGYRQLQAGAVVLATGCRERPIGALSIAGTRPMGVYTAGAAQKMINLGGYDIGNRFVILGSGDVGLIVARELALRGKEVIAVIEKEDKCGGLPRNRINCLEKFGIPLIINSTVSEVFGLPRVEGITVSSLECVKDSVDTGTGSYEGGMSPRFIACDTLITSVGLIPERELLDGFLADGIPEWLFLCGNACFVHDIVDDVTVESERTGQLAAEYVMRGRGKGVLIGPDMVHDATVLNASAERGELRNDSSVICVACPKGCVVAETADGWSGLACGRAEPEF